MMQVDIDSMGDVAQESVYNRKMLTTLKALETVSKPQIESMKAEQQVPLDMEGEALRWFQRNLIVWFGVVAEAAVESPSSCVV